MIETNGSCIQSITLESLSLLLGRHYSNLIICFVYFTRSIKIDQINNESPQVYISGRWIWWCQFIFHTLFNVQKLTVSLNLRVFSLNLRVFCVCKKNQPKLLIFDIYHGGIKISYNGINKHQLSLVPCIRIDRKPTSLNEGFHFVEIKEW